MGKKPVRRRRKPSDDFELAKITNSLLRLDGITGTPPAPFELPNPKMEFFVLELGFHDDVDAFCAYTMKALKKHGEFIGKMRATGVTVTLFVEFAAPECWFRFEAAFLSHLTEHDIALEYCRAPD